ncbi:MAG: hypothetical protein HQL41_15925 [Alphaproteobacteria bacterium]|nr:hypothetical protein [Alphaproteobacteria bacterium]
MKTIAALVLILLAPPAAAQEAGRVIPGTPCIEGTPNCLPGGFRRPTVAPPRPTDQTQPMLGTPGVPMAPAEEGPLRVVPRAADPRDIIGIDRGGLRPGFESRRDETPGY